jgi:hypothetical protein
MKLELVWNKPIRLTKATKKDGLIYNIDLELIPDKSGIYIFARQFGKSFEGLYIGRSANMRSRAKGHLNNLRLMKHLELAPIGKRVLITGIPITKPGQKIDNVLKVLEKALIRYLIAEGHDLVNLSGIKVRQHEIVTRGKIPKAFIPASIFLEK